MTVVSACRSDNESAPPTIEVTRVATSSTAIESDESQVLVEVTRVVVETEVVEVSPQAPTKQPESKLLTICVGQEPSTLYPYGRSGQDIAVTHLLQGIYENMFTMLTYEYQPRGVEKLPSLADGDAIIKQIAVQEGDQVYDVNDDVVILREGVTVIAADGQEVTFEGDPLTMSQMVVEFTLRPLVWSDGTPVNAGDSAYSFKLAADPETPVPKYKIERTENYEATGDLTLKWTGVPGYMDRTYFTNIWTPLPQHYWEQYQAGELLEADESTTMPLSHGPYVVEEWVTGDHITLSKNTNYYLASEGLPKVDVIRINFIDNDSQLLAQLLSGECDIGTHDGISLRESPLLIESEATGQLVPYFQSGTVFEHIDFGINPIENYASERPDWFEDVRVRQAFVMCTNRQAMLEEALFGRAQIVHTYAPADNPLYPDNVVEWPYDVDAANNLLDEAGYLDSDGDGIREDPSTGSRFNVTLLGASGNMIGEKVASAFREDLLMCGIEVELEFVNSEQYFADGPEGPLFGRRFDLGAFPWLIDSEPNCGLYLSSNTPGPDNGWDRRFNNETGFSNPEFDSACQVALNTLPGQEGFETSHAEALRIWSQQVPIIPLFLRLKVAATRPGIENFAMDPTQNSELWNIYELDVEPK